MNDAGDQRPRLQLLGITKRYGNTLALNDVSLSVGAGEAVAVIGENGAGKSTLMKVLAGVVAPDSGRLLIDGNQVADAASFSKRSPRDAMDAGIALIHQELNLHDNLNVAENLFLGREPRTRLGILRRGEMNRQAKSLLQRVGLDVVPEAPVEGLPIATKQLIEIARALSMNARIVIMDEPTSSLSEAEAAALFGLVQELQADGVSILYISHRLSEITRLADRVEVMRDGCHVATLTGDDMNADTMVRHMVGRDLGVRDRDRPDVGDVIMNVCDLKVGSTTATPVSFQVHADHHRCHID